MKEMNLTFVNVGYGEAMLLECPDPRREDGVFVLVIDGGSGEAQEYQDRSSGRVPLADYLAARRLGHIDVIAVTHIHEDHLCGLLPLLESWSPGELWQTLPEGLHRSLGPLPSLPGASDSQRKFLHSLNDYRELCAQVQSAGGRVKVLQAGWETRPCPDLTIRCLAPSPLRAAELAERCRALDWEEEGFSRRLDALDAAMNNYSAILLLEYRGTRVLLPGDANRLGYGGIAPQDLSAHIFKIGHHGQRDGADAALMEAVRPKAVVCCASSDRRYQSADPETLRLFSGAGAALYFSDCPPCPGLTPHQALVFTIGARGAFSAEYQ